MIMIKQTQMMTLLNLPLQGLKIDYESLFLIKYELIQTFFDC